MMNVTNTLKSQSGFGLIALTVAMILMTSFILLTIQITLGALRAIQFAKIKSEVEDLRNYIRVSVDCQRTVATLPPPIVPTPGTPGTPTSIQYIALNGRNGNPVVLAGAGGVFTRLGDYILRAKVSNLPNVYEVEWSRDNVDFKGLFSSPNFACPVSR